MAASAQAGGASHDRHPVSYSDICRAIFGAFRHLRHRHFCRRQGGVTLMCDFTYGFDELEIAPGLMAAGEADFIKRPNGSFEMTGLSLYWHPTEALRVTNDSDWIWKAVERALIDFDDKAGVLGDAYDKANVDEYDPDYMRDERIERMRIGLI